MCPQVSLKSEKCRASTSMLLVQRLRLLTTLDVSGYNITDQGADIISTVLMETASLTKLDLSNTKLNTANAVKIVITLRNISSLKVFNINSNDIDNGAVDSITTFICNSPLIEIMNFSNNKLSCVGVPNNLLENIEAGYVLDNMINLATALSKCPVLRELNISQNSLTLTDVLTIAHVLRWHPTLQSLDLSNNNIAFPSACEFIVDVFLSVNQTLVNLNVCGRNIRPRYIEEYLFSPSNESSSTTFTLQSRLYSFQSSLIDIQTIFVKVTETCPLSSAHVMSYNVDHVGGVFYNQCHNFAIVVPPGAVSLGYCVEIQATADSFSPYRLPDGFYPISSHFWISANYTFKAPIYFIMHHYAKIRSLEDINNLHVFYKSMQNSHNDLMTEIPDGVFFDSENRYCVLATSHFCSYCQAKSIKLIPEYLSAHYCSYDDLSSESHIGEVCFCPSNTECKQVIIKQCEKRNAKRHNPVTFIVADGDKLCISSIDSSHSNEWNIMQTGKLNITHLCDFEYWKIYEGLTVEQLKEKEEDFAYPPRLQIQCVQGEASKSLHSSFKISKTSNMDEPIAQFPLHKKVTVTSNTTDTTPTSPNGGAQYDTFTQCTTGTTATSPSGGTQSDKSKLEEKPALKVISRFIRYFASDWRIIGCELSLKPEDISNIDSTAKDNKNKCFDMLIKWLGTDVSATYNKLVDALCEHDLNDAAEKIKDKLLKEL